jgi:hypothetical protein
MERFDAASVPDNVPEEWSRRYGTRGPAGRGAPTNGGRDEDRSLTQLVVWLSVVTGVSSVVAWLMVGFPGIVAVVVPVAVLGGGSVLFVRLMSGSGRARSGWSEDPHGDR